MNIKSLAGSAIRPLIVSHQKKRYRSNLKTYEEALNVKAVLSSEEITAAKEAGLNKDYLPYLKFYKSVTGNFDLNFIPCWLYAILEQSLNHRRFEGFAQHKCNLHYFIPVEHRAKTFAYSIDGVLYDSENRIITRSEFMRILQNEREFVFKIATGTGGGKGVKKIHTESPESMAIVTDALDKRYNDFICQDIIRQSDFMSSLSGGSVNTIRMLTLNLNGCFSLLSAFLRMGTPGSFTDNLCSGGTLCGIDEEGCFSDFGYTHSFDVTTVSPSGKVLKGLRIPDFDKLTAFCEKMSYNFQQMHLIGWDIAIREDGEPVVIEVNLDSAELPPHQMFNGPVFGDRTEEVLEYYKSHKPFYSLKVPY